MSSQRHASTGVSWRLVEATADLAIQAGYTQLYYWVGTDNARAIGFGKNFGFRTTDSRRPARPSDFHQGEDEIAMVLGAGARHYVGAEPDKREGSHPRRTHQLRPD